MLNELFLKIILEEKKLIKLLFFCVLACVKVLEL